jgi:hypothetical protein
VEKKKKENGNLNVILNKNVAIRSGEKEIPVEILVCTNMYEKIQQ